MKKSILILIFLLMNLYSVTLSSKSVKNANTLLLILEEKNIKDPKLTFGKKNINFFKHPNNSSFYALVPISYYEKPGKKRIIISYIKDKKKIFKGVSFKVIDGKYKSETISVSKGKVSLSKENKIRTKKEYQEAMKIYNYASSKILTNNKYVLPLNSKITSSFGKKRVYNKTLKSYHSGTDFKAKDNTPIKAVNSGKIVIAKNRFYAGNSIVIDHGNGIFSCYFHLNSMNYKVGDIVKKGDIIGLSGSTGRVTGPHLHFAFRVHGLVVDPLQLIKILNNNQLY